MYATTIKTQVGPFTLISDGRAVFASGWTDDISELLGRISTSLRPDRVHEGGSGEDFIQAAAAYHEGDLDPASKVPVKQQSGEFTMKAWDRLRDVRPGEPISYEQFARLAGNPRAVRAAASVCARNAAALFVPCHRVIRSDASLGGFRWGLDVKGWLLSHELSRASRTSRTEPAEPSRAEPR